MKNIFILTSIVLFISCQSETVKKLPTVTTKNIENITSNSAEGGGNVIDDGGDIIISRGVCWSINELPTINDYKIENGRGLGNYNIILTNLTSNTKFYVRAFATNSIGTSYGSQTSFTSAIVLTKPLVTTNSILNITATTAVTGGNVLSDGNAPISERGIAYSLTTNPTINDSKIISQTNGIGQYSINLIGLTDNTTYYIRAYAINSQGVSYGETINFKTEKLPLAEFKVDFTEISLGKSIQFTDLSQNNPNTWSWDFGDGTKSNIQNPSHTYLQTGIYTIELKISNNYGSSTIIKNNYIRVDEIIQDIDGNEYKVISIGTQKWMGSNLATTKYKNGDIIPTTIPANLDISSENSPKYQWTYNGNSNNVRIYGRLYTWFAANDVRGICPSGWHLPTLNEYEVLINYLENTYKVQAGGLLKEQGIEYWADPNVDATNKSNFSARPGGSRQSDFSDIRYSGFWWTSTELYGMAYSLYLRNSNMFHIFNTPLKRSGLSVRCIKN